MKTWREEYNEWREEHNWKQYESQKEINNVIDEKLEELLDARDKKLNELGNLLELATEGYYENK